MAARLRLMVARCPAECGRKCFHRYSARIEAEASEATILALIEQTDRVAHVMRNERWCRKDHKFATSDA